MASPKYNHGPWLDPKTIANVDVPIIKDQRKMKRFRGGTLELRKRTRMPDKWVLHYQLTGFNQKVTHHAVTVGTIVDYPTREQADVAAEPLRKRIRDGCHLELRNAPKTKYLVHYKAYYTATQYQGQLVAQGGKCAICGDEPDRLHYDHDHSNGALRGLLCSHCNKGIGCLKDSPTFCESAAVYLRKYGKT